MQGAALFGLVHKSALWKCRVSTATQRTALFESVVFQLLCKGLFRLVLCTSRHSESVVFQLLCKGLLRFVLCTSRHSESVVFQLLRKGLLCLKASCFNCYARGFSVWSCARVGTLKVSCFNCYARGWSVWSCAQVGTLKVSCGNCYAKDCFVWKRRVSTAMQGASPFGLVHKSALWKCRFLTAMQGALWKCRVSTATQRTALFESVVFQLLCKGLLRLVLCTSRHSESVVFQLLCKGLLRLVLCTSRHSESVVFQLLCKGLLCLKASRFNCYARGFSVWSCAHVGTLKASCFNCYAMDCLSFQQPLDVFCFNIKTNPNLKIWESSGFLIFHVTEFVTMRWNARPLGARAIMIYCVVGSERSEHPALFHGVKAAIQIGSQPPVSSWIKFQSHLKMLGYDGLLVVWLVWKNHQGRCRRCLADVRLTSSIPFTSSSSLWASWHWSFDNDFIKITVLLCLIPAVLVLGFHLSVIFKTEAWTSSWTWTPFSPW